MSWCLFSCSRHVQYLHVRTYWDGRLFQTFFSTIASLGQLHDFDLCFSCRAFWWQFNIESGFRLLWVAFCLFKVVFSQLKYSQNTMWLEGICLHDQLPAAMADLAHPPWAVKAGIRRQENAIEGTYLAKLKAALTCFMDFRVSKSSQCAFQNVHFPREHSCNSVKMVNHRKEHSFFSILVASHPRNARIERDFGLGDMPMIFREF